VLITCVELQNVKSYYDETVHFTQGTNAICGENGAGKSTVLEAIGFALFDYLPYTQADFVREGEKTATITVSFVSNRDEREYQVVRRCGASSDYYVYDPELDGKLVNGKTDVLDWLREHLGVEANSDLPALFRDAVGVPQGLLTAPFLQRPSERKPLFDRLLRVDEYEQAWKALREALRFLEERLAGHRETIAGLGAQVQRLPDLRRRAETLAADVSRIETRLAALAAELGAATARLENLEGIKSELDELVKQVAVLSTRLEGVAAQLAAAERAVAEAEEALAIVEASRAGYEAYRQIQAALAGLEAERAERDRLQAGRATLERSLALARERVRALEDDVLEVEEAEARMQELRPEVERQREWEAALKAVHAQVRSLELAEAGAAERRRQMQDLQERRAALEVGLAEAGRVEADVRATRDRLEETRLSLADLRSEQAGLAAEINRLVEQTETLEASADAPEAAAALCPVCEQPLTAEHRAELIARNRVHLEELEARSRALDGEAGAAGETSAALERQIEALERKLQSLPRPVDKADLEARLGALQGDLSDIEGQLEKLSGSAEESERLERHLAELGDPRRRYERLAETAARRPQLEEKLEAEGHAAGDMEISLTEIDQALVPFADLDRRLAEGRAGLEHHEGDYRRYLENNKITADLPARRQHAERLRQQQAALTAERDAAQVRADEVAAGFDMEALHEARQHQAGLLAEQAGLKGQLDGLGQQLTETRGEIDGLEAAERALAEAQAAQSRDQRLCAETEFIREIIRRAGPHVTRRLIQQVSLEGARLFADVMADHSARLRWEDNYEIVLERNGRDRGFQQLSGGEQMAAALSVRLALLRELSAIDVAFFDEPTSNLDDTRRDGLAEQILSVKGFSQLFVISHDDTFERVTHHVVRVHKADGVSKVEVQ
jgi:exonuclease SbcC